MDFSLAKSDFEDALQVLHQLALQSAFELWRTARIISTADGSIFRLRRKLIQPRHIHTSSTHQHGPHGGYDDDTSSDDPEELYDAARRPSEQSVVYEIAFSTSYQVPVLYLHFDSTDLSTSSLDPALLEHLMPVVFQSQVRHIGTMGAITVTDHPVSHTPVYFVHPCNTQQAIRAICGGIRPSPLVFLARWIGCFGSAVGLSLPMDLLPDRCLEAFLHTMPE